MSACPSYEDGYETESFELPDTLKAPYSTKNSNFIIQERFDKLIYSSNTII